MKMFHFVSRIRLGRPREEAFRFFADALNLEEITPPWLRFRIVSKLPIVMRRGAEIEYRLRIHGIPLGWRSQITVWDPPYRFVDEQVRGPYRMWIHEHSFIEESDGTLCEDHVRYVPPGGALVNKLFVQGDVQKIFSHRAARLQQIFREGSAQEAYAR